MPKLAHFVLSTAVFLGILSSCGIAQDGSSRLQDAPASNANYSRGSVVPAQVKLYTTPDAHPLPSCDVFAAMTLANGYVGPLVYLRNERVGSCEVMLEPQDRSYQLKETGADCGSRVYVGTRSTANSEEPVAVKVTDHRARECHDGVPASIIVEEKYRDGEAIHLYSKAPKL